MRNRRLLLLNVIALMGVAGCSDTTTPSPTGTTPASAPTRAGNPPDYNWTPATAAPFKRTEVAAGVLGGRIWVLGGFEGSGGATADVGVYDPGANSWAAGPKLPEAVHHPSAAGDGTRLWIAGGYTHGPRQAPTAAVRFIDAGGTWRDGPPLPEPRAAGALAWDGRRLVFGGGVGPSGVSGDVFALEGGTWRRVGALSVAREHLAAASDGQGNTWFLAGRLRGLDTNRSDVDLVSGDKVVRLGQVGTARGGVAGFHLPDLGGCVAGGEHPSGTFNNVECVKLDGSATSLPPLAMSRHGLGAVALNGAAYALLGGPNPGLTVSDTVEVLRVPAK